MYTIAYLFRTVLMALVIAATAISSASASTWASADSCTKFEATHAPEHHARVAEIANSQASAGLGNFGEGHDALHCGVHVCAAVVDLGLGVTRTERLATADGTLASVQFVFADRYGALHRPPNT